MNNKPGRELIPLLLVEDDELLSLSIKDFLDSMGYKVYLVNRCDEAKNILDHHTVNIALVDKKLPDGVGTSISEYIIENKLKTKMILMTAYGIDQEINEYIRKGAFDFLEKPFSLEKLLKRIENVNRMFELEYSHEALELYQKSTYKIIGISAVMQKIKKMTRLAAQSPSPVLIQGETGTGKELVARNIHLESKRSGKQFISVNCASIPEHLFESEFFGYKKGAFTGAYKEKPGYFEMANYGVLHLDEIGDMPMEFQAKLLRVLEEGSYFKLGGTKEMEVDVRIIASTNKNLKEEVEKKQFREDLYFRIAVFTIYLPPLRERKEDIPVLAEYLWHDLTEKMGKKTVTPSFSFEELKKYPWQGNIRELRNYLEQKLIYANMPEVFQPEIPTTSPGKQQENREIKPLEDHIRDYVLESLEYFDFNKARTARELGLSLSTLQRKLRGWGVTVQKGLDAK